MPIDHGRSEMVTITAIIIVAAIGLGALFLFDWLFF